MTVKKLVGISLAWLMLLGFTPFGFSEPLKIQLEQEMEIEELQCNNANHVLVLRTNGKMACVTESTAEKMKWKKIISTETLDDVKELLIDDSSTLNDVDSIKYDAALMSILETDLVFTNKQINSNVIYESGLSNPLKWPTYEVTFPRTAQVGVPFNVVYDYAYVIPDEETGSYVDFNEQCLESTFCSKQYFSAKVSSFVDVESNNLEYFSETFDQKMIPMRNYTTYDYHPEFDNTRPLQEIFTFIINEPDDVYRIGEINVSINQDNDDLVYFYVDENGTVIFDPLMVKETFEQSSFAISSAPSVMSVASAMETEMDKLREPSFEEWKERQNIVESPTGSRIGPPPEAYEFFAEKLLDEYPNEENYEEFLRFHNFTQSWIDDFLGTMTKLKPQSFNFITSYTLLPLAYGVGETTTITGNLVNTDEDDSSVFVHGATVCAYDVGNSSLNPIIIDNKHVCVETINSGFFVFNVPTADPDGSGNTDLVLKAFAKNSHFEFFLNNNEDKVIIDDNDIFNDISAIEENIGNFDISEQIYLNVPIEHQHFWALDRMTDIQEWYTDNVVANTEKISVIYDPELCGSGAGYDPDTSKMFLSHTEKPDGTICSLNVNSPLTNTDTLAHEYGHVVFYQTYDSFSSAYPVVDITDPSGYHSPVHSNSDGTAWVEGWAFFMATAYSGSPTYQPSYMAGQWNFETRTHNEVSDSTFAGKSFVDGNSGEGNVAAALWDALDTVNESGDDQQSLLDEMWDTMGDFVESDETVIATDISQYKDDWDDEGNPDIENIFDHNTLVYATTPSPTGDPTFFIEDFEGDLSKWDLTNGDPVLSERWELKTPFTQIPGYPVVNIVAGTDNDCDISCIMTLKTSLDLSELADAKLLITRWVDRSLDPGNTPMEGLLVEVSGNGGLTWSTAYEWTADDGHDIDAWFKGEDISDVDVYNLPSSDLTNNFKIRISGTSSASSETIYIDDVKITSSSVEPPDITAPVITLLPPTIMNIPVNTLFVEPGYSAIDDIDGDITNNVIVAGSVDATTLGTYSITYDVLDAANNHAVQKTRTVNVIDTIPPVFNFVPSDQTFEATGLDTPLSESDYGIATATDNYDPSPIITNNASSTFPLGNTIIQWIATDQSNNFVNTNQIITIEDTTSPVITLNPTNPQIIEVGTIYSELGATASDNLDGDISASIIIDDSVIDINNVGMYTVTYDVSDSVGNDAVQIARTVNVVNISSTDTTPPIITLTGENPQTIILGNDYTELGAIAIDNDSNYSGNVIIDSSSVNTSLLGSYVISYTADTDPSGNIGPTITRTVNVVESTTPLPTEGQITGHVTIVPTSMLPTEGQITGHVTIVP